MGTTVKLLHSGMTGAPLVYGDIPSGGVGGIKSVLQACLVNGFGSASVDSIVVSGGIATVNRAAGHTFEVDVIVSISGGTTSGGGDINGEHTVLSIPNGTSYTFDATGIADQTIGGSPMHKFAPLGWEELFPGTNNMGAFRSLDPLGTGCVLCVDDTVVQSSIIRCYTSMSNITTGTDYFGGVYWPRSNITNTDTNGRPWTLIGDSRGFFFQVRSTFQDYGCTVHFGDFASNKSPDPYGCSVTGPGSNQAGSVNGSLSWDIAYSYSSSLAVYQLAPRGVSGLGSQVQMYRGAPAPIGSANGTYSGQITASHMIFPNIADNGLYVSQYTLAETTPQYIFRGIMPGAYFVPQQVGPSVFGQRARLSNVIGLSGRRMCALVSASGPVFYDLTGPWAR